MGFAKIPFSANKFENYILRTPIQTVLVERYQWETHCVVQVDDTNTANVAELGSTFREQHERFPDKVNVGFMQVLNRGHIKLRVYERGVVNESLW